MKETEPFGETTRRPTTTTTTTTTTATATTATTTTTTTTNDNNNNNDNDNDDDNDNNDNNDIEAHYITQNYNPNLARPREAVAGEVQPSPEASKDLRGKRLSNTTFVTHVFFKRGEYCGT